MRAVCRTPFDAAAALPEAMSRAPAGLFGHVAVKHGAGFVSLNVGDLRPGDVLLFRGRAKASHIVRSAQRPLFDESTAEWTHCAIIDRNLSVWDARPDLNVGCRALNDLLRSSHTITAVRPVVEVDPARLERSLVEFSGQSYSSGYDPAAVSWRGTRRWAVRRASLSATRTRCARCSWPMSFDMPPGTASSPISRSRCRPTSCAIRSSSRSC